MFILILSCFWILQYFAYIPQACSTLSHLRGIGNGEVRCIQTLLRHQYRTFECSCHRSLALYPAFTCTKRSRTVFFKFSCLAILAINDCLTPIDNRGRLALFCSIRCKIIATLFPRKKLFSCIYLSGLRYEIIMLCLIHIKMYCFYSH